MFDTLQNTVSIEFTLVPDGPILVRSQNASLDPGIADSEFQRTWKHGRRTVFLAGSGLKGVLRSHFERLLRSNGLFACDPTQWKTRCDPEDGRPEAQGRQPHGNLCAACFTFGCTRLAGRFRFADSYPAEDLWDETNRTETRTGVGIDRRSQGASTGVLYDTEVVVAGGFKVQLRGENFALWQLALVMQSLEDLDAGFVQIGGCKSRGMGNVKLRDQKMEFRFLDTKRGRLTGAGRTPREIRKYGLSRDEAIPIGENEGIEEARRGLFRLVTFKRDAVKQLCERLANGPLAEYLSRGAIQNG